MTNRRTVGFWGCMSLFLAAGCSGPAEVSENEQIRDSAHTRVNSFVRAILDRDAKAIEEHLSKPLLDAAAKAGPDIDATVLSGFESQREGLVAQFGEATLRQGVEVVDVRAHGKDEVAIQLRIGGRIIEKPVYFVDEDGLLRFGGAFGTQSAAELVASGVNNYDYSWRVANYGTFAHWAYCGFENARLFGINPGSSYLQTCYSTQCTWFGSTCTQFVDPRNAAVVMSCVYQVVGNDFWFDGNDVANCFAHSLH